LYVNYLYIEVSKIMSSFANTTTRVLVVGALLLGAGIYYQDVASQRVDEARQAVHSVEAAQSQLETARQRAQKYVSLLENMADRNIDRQEPFSVVSEFSPEEIKQIGPLLDTLYQRDGHFFLQRFQLTWRTGIGQHGLLPRVALDLEGQKVLLFSDEIADASSFAVVKH
jgi:type II secretory pathway pseudopilin PulG